MAEVVDNSQTGFVASIGNLLDVVITKAKDINSMANDWALREDQAAKNEAAAKALELERNYQITSSDLSFANLMLRNKVVTAGIAAGALIVGLYVFKKVFK